jgi:hypothetical protein
MASRFDLSEKLIHFTSGDSYEDAFERLRAIIRDGRLIASHRMIRGGYRCVSFTEAPPHAFTRPLTRYFPFNRYSPFGLMFDKTSIFERGGRHVIYQTDAEFHLLLDEQRWRHVRYEPRRDPAIDFTWEREWRISCDELPFTPEEAVIVVPDQQWADALLRKHEHDQNRMIDLYATCMDLEIAEMYRRPFHWQVESLEQPDSVG